MIQYLFNICIDASIAFFIDSDGFACFLLLLFVTYPNSGVTDHNFYNSSGKLSKSWASRHKIQSTPRREHHHSCERASDLFPLHYQLPLFTSEVSNSITWTNHQTHLGTRWLLHSIVFSLLLAHHNHNSFDMSVHNYIRLACGVLHSLPLALLLQCLFYISLNAFFVYFIKKPFYTLD